MYLKMTGTIDYDSGVKYQDVLCEKNAREADGMKYVQVIGPIMTHQIMVYLLNIALTFY